MLGKEHRKVPKEAAHGPPMGRGSPAVDIVGLLDFCQSGQWFFLVALFAFL